MDKAHQEPSRYNLMRSSRLISRSHHFDHFIRLRPYQRIESGLREMTSKEPKGHKVNRLTLVDPMRH
jgi:hypothetical protein